MPEHESTSLFNIVVSVLLSLGSDYSEYTGRTSPFWINWICILSVYHSTLPYWIVYAGVYLSPYVPTTQMVRIQKVLAPPACESFPTMSDMRPFEVGHMEHKVHTYCHKSIQPEEDQQLGFALFHLHSWNYHMHLLPPLYAASHNLRCDYWNKVGYHGLSQPRIPQCIITIICLNSVAAIPTNRCLRSLFLGTTLKMIFTNFVMPNLTNPKVCSIWKGVNFIPPKRNIHATSSRLPGEYEIHQGL